MRVLKNQTLYQCEYCNKRLLTKQGARIHEEKYCKQSPIVKQKRLEKIKSCNHKWDMKYRRMPGESHLLEPDYEYCVECGVTEREWMKIQKGGA